MFLFVLAAGLVYSLLLGATLVIEREFFMLMQPVRPLGSVVLSVLVVPTIAAWLSAELIGAMRPPRLLDSRVRGWGARIGAGLIAGVLGVVGGTLGLILLDRALPDAVLTGAAAAASTLIVLLPLPRQRAFACPRCAYDLSGASPASGGVCTECGFDLMSPTRGPLPYGRGSLGVSASRTPSDASRPASCPLPGCP